MGEVSTIGLDIAKSVFQVHGVDADGAVVIRKRVSRAKILEFFGEFPASICLDNNRDQCSCFWHDLFVHAPRT